MRQKAQTPHPWALLEKKLRWAPASSSPHGSTTDFLYPESLTALKLWLPMRELGFVVFLFLGLVCFVGFGFVDRGPRQWFETVAQGHRQMFAKWQCLCVITRICCHYWSFRARKDIRICITDASSNQDQASHESVSTPSPAWKQKSKYTTGHLRQI